MEKRIEQIKINAISAKILHRKSRWKYELINKSISALTLIVPINFLIVQFVTLGSNYEALMTILSWVLTGLMITLSIIGLLIGLNEKISAHSAGMKSNIFIMNECDNLLSSKAYSQINWFFKYVAEIDNQDNELLTNISEKTRRRTYINALKESKPGDYEIVCPKCHSSPWDYKKGDCQLCGNTPLKT